MVAGLVLAGIGVYLIAGLGWACLGVGLVLFIAGGVSGRKG